MGHGSDLVSGLSQLNMVSPSPVSSSQNMDSGSIYLPVLLLVGSSWQFSMLRGYQVQALWLRMNRLKS